MPGMQVLVLYSLQLIVGEYIRNNHIVSNTSLVPFLFLSTQTILPKATVSQHLVMPSPHQSH